MPINNIQPKGWKETTLGEVAEILSGSTPSTKNPEYWDGDIPWITPKDLTGFTGVYISKGERNITEDGLNNSSAQLLPKYAVLFSSRAPIGYVAIADRELTTNQGFKNIVCEEKKTHYKYIFYWLKQNGKYIEKQASGSTFSEATATLMRGIKIALPSFTEQHSIAAVLSSLDDKIELLRRQNETLEAMARAIFHEWFVAFNFPNEHGKPHKASGGRMIESELGEIPEGWRVGSIRQVVDIFDAQRIPLSSREREARRGVYPYYGATTIMDYVDDYLFDGVYLLLAEDGSVIDERGYPFLQYVWGKFWANNHAHILQGKNGFSTELLYLLFRQTKVAGIVTGAVQLKINQGNLLEYSIVLPADVVLKNVNQTVQTLFAKYRSNCEQTKQLGIVRDTLLPKLMSGEIRA